MGVGWWTGTTSLRLIHHLCSTLGNVGGYEGASAESGGTAVTKRESYEGGRSKEKEGTGGNALKLGCRWVLGFGNGV